MSTLSGTTVLVTGAGGFIGSHLCEELVRRGARVCAFVHYNSRGGHGWLDSIDAEIKSGIEVVLGDVADYHRVRGAMQGCDTAFHLAALIGIPYSYHAPDSYVRVNITGTLNVLQAANDTGIARLVHTSTSEAYGTALVAPIDEQHPLQAQSPYAATKIAADKLAESFHRSFATPVVTVRPFNTFGPRQSARAVIPTVIGQVLAGAREVRIGATTPTRDMNFVSNTVDGMIAAALAPADVLGQVVNIGSGREIAIGDLACTILRLMNSDARLVSDEERLRPAASEVERLLCDASKARRLLAWEPRLGLDEGLARTIDWFRANPGVLRAEGYVV